jgi:long-chain fatty acid transport protein
VQEHISFGATWRLQSGKEINIAYQHAFGRTLNGSGSIPESFGGGNANLNMHQDVVGVGFGWGK